MERIKDLTPEQVCALQDHYRAWGAVALGTGPADRKLVQNAIGKLYAASGHDWPSFVWYESPRELLTFAKSLGRFGLARCVIRYFNHYDSKRAKSRRESCFGRC